MALIFETDNFTVEAEDHPLIDRSDGGHIVIAPKEPVLDRQHLHPHKEIELMRLSSVVGQAMQDALSNNGIDIGRINYQDNGNWQVNQPLGPQFHLHLFGRAKNSTRQPFGEALNFPNIRTHPEMYEGLLPLDKNDIAAIKAEIGSLLETDEYSEDAWGL